MQEVVKKEKNPDPYFILCIAKAHDKKYPVILPYRTYGVKPGDIVFFKPDGAAVEGEIIFTKDYCKTDDDIWTALMIMAEREPIKAIRYASAEVLKWEDT